MIQNRLPQKKRLKIFDMLVMNGWNSPAIWGKKKKNAYYISK